VLETLANENLLSKVTALGERLSAGLRRIQERFPKLCVDCRGRGLLQAIVLADAIDARAVLTKLQEAGLLLTVAGTQALRFSPPLVVSAEELDEALAILTRVLDSMG
jgi:acetylornithine/N-succinyldiaminopimelate aminotransferase